MKFKYIGDTESTTAFGYTFEVDNPVEVTEEHAIKKLLNNQYFTEVKAQKAKAKNNGYSSRDKR